MTATAEVGTIPAPDLREILREAVDRHAPVQELAALRAVEESKRDGLRTALEHWAHRQDSENLLV